VVDSIWSAIHILWIDLFFNCIAYYSVTYFFISSCNMSSVVASSNCCDWPAAMIGYESYTPGCCSQPDKQQLVASQKDTVQQQLASVTMGGRGDGREGSHAFMDAAPQCRSDKKVLAKAYYISCLSAKLLSSLTRSQHGRLPPTSCPVWRELQRTDNIIRNNFVISIPVNVGLSHSRPLTVDESMCSEWMRT